MGCAADESAVFEFSEELPFAQFQREYYRILPPRPMTEPLLTAGWSSMVTRPDGAGPMVWALGDASEVTLWVARVRDLEARFEAWVPGEGADALRRARRP